MRFCSSKEKEKFPLESRRVKEMDDEVCAEGRRVEKVFMGIERLGRVGIP